jgi:Cu/Ag efflux protein CusF
MMKNGRILLLTLVSLIAVVSMAFAAAGEKTDVPSALPVAANIQQITGEIKAVNSKSVTVAKKLGNKVIAATVAVNDQTKITKGKESKTLTDIKAGDKAVVQYTKTGNKNVAKSIDLKPATPEESKP